MVEVHRPNVAQTRKCLQDALSSLKTSANISDETKELFSKELGDLIELADAALAGTDAGNAKFEFNYKDLMTRLESLKQDALIARLKKSGDKKATAAMLKKIDRLAKGDVMAQVRIMREMIEPTAGAGGRGVEVPAGRGNILNEVDVTVSRIIGRLEKYLKKAEPGVWYSFLGKKDSKFARDLALILYGGRPANPDKMTALAYEAAKIFREETGGLIDRANAAGNFIRKDEVWGVSDLDAFRIRAMGEEDFVSFMVARMDDVKMKDPDAAARAMFHNAGHYNSTNSVAARKIFYKTPEARLEVFDKLSGRSVADLLQSNISQLSHTTVWAEKWGPSGVQNFLKTAQQMHDSIDKVTNFGTVEAPNLKTGLVPRSAKGILKETISMTKFHAGLLEPVDVGFWATSAGTLRNLAVASLLRYTGLHTVFSDIPNGLLRNMQLGGSAVRTMADQGKYVADVIAAFVKPSHYKHLIEHLDAMNAGFQAAQANDLISTRLASTTGKFGKAGRAVDISFLGAAKAAKLQYWAGFTNRLSNASYIGMQTSTLRILSKAGKTMSDVKSFSPELHNSLSKAGITDTMWQQIADDAHRAGNLLDPSLIADPKVKQAIAGWMRAESYVYIPRADNKMNWHVQTLFGGFDDKPAAQKAMTVLAQFFAPTLSVGRSFLRKINSSGRYGFAGRAAFGSGALVAMTYGGMAHVQTLQALKGNPQYDWDDPLLKVLGMDKAGIFAQAGAVYAAGERNERVRGTWDIDAKDVYGMLESPFSSSAIEFTAGAVPLIRGFFDEDYTEEQARKQSLEVWRAFETYIPGVASADIITTNFIGKSMIDFIREDFLYPDLDLEEKRNNYQDLVTTQK